MPTVPLPTDAENRHQPHPPSHLRRRPHHPKLPLPQQLLVSPRQLPDNLAHTWADLRSQSHHARPRRPTRPPHPRSWTSPSPPATTARTASTPTADIGGLDLCNQLGTQAGENVGRQATSGRVDMPRAFSVLPIVEPLCRYACKGVLRRDPLSHSPGIALSHQIDALGQELSFLHSAFASPPKRHLRVPAEVISFCLPIVSIRPAPQAFRRMA